MGKRGKVNAGIIHVQCFLWILLVVTTWLSFPSTTFFLHHRNFAASGGWLILADVKSPAEAKVAFLIFSGHHGHSLLELCLCFYLSEQYFYLYFWEAIVYEKSNLSNQEGGGRFNSLYVTFNQKKAGQSSLHTFRNLNLLTSQQGPHCMCRHVN